jgi:aminopeptidase YwaD
MRLRRLCLFVVVASLGLAVFKMAAAAGDSFDPGRYLDHIKFLASPEMKGRATGSPELEKAAAYIANQFKADGIPPVPGQTGYLQPFEVTASATLGRNNRFEVASGGSIQTLQVSKEFVPFNFSSSGKASASVVFAGYGITAPENNYDDYRGLDVKGKFVLVFAHEPREHDPKSVGNAFYAKASNARAHGARGVIVVNDRINHASDADNLERFGNTDGPTDAGILFVQVKEEVVKPWFQAAGKDIEQLERDIDKDLQPRSFALPRVEVRETIDVERAVKTAHNVVAYLPGQTDEYIVVGAHYDHLGLGGQFSLAPSLTGTVHPGADDNASGTAGVLELARYFASQPKPKRGFLFMTFAGEELGLLGSSYYTKHPELPLAKAVTMINMDMIGRVQNGKLYIGGAGTGTSLRSDLDRITPQFDKLKIDYSGNDGYGSSDHTSFTAQQVPVLFFFSGLHGDYHKPSDTWDKIDSAAAVQVLQLVAEVASRIDNDAERPQFVRVEPTNPHSGSAGPVSGSGGGGYGPDFGSIPDFAEPPKGVRFADVRPGSPAALAGLKAGDILVKFGDRDIANLYDFTYALRARKPGDEVPVEVLRPGLPGANDEKLTVKVKLTVRK